MVPLFKNKLILLQSTSLYSNKLIDLYLLQAADHLDDEEDIEDEETALANFTTSIDNDETDEYIAFRTSLQGMTVCNDFSVFVFHKSSLSIKASCLQPPSPIRMGMSPFFRTPPKASVSPLSRFLLNYLQTRPLSRNCVMITVIIAQTKKFLKLFRSYSFGIETINTFIHSRSSLENHTRFQTKMSKVYTRFQTKKAQKPYLLGRHIPIWLI